MDVQEACEAINTDTRRLFVRAHRMFGGPYQVVSDDFKRWEKTKILPSYVGKYLAYKIDH